MSLHNSAAFDPSAWANNSSLKDLNISLNQLGALNLSGWGSHKTPGVPINHVYSPDDLQKVLQQLKEQYPDKLQEFKNLEPVKALISQISSDREFNDKKQPQSTAQASTHQQHPHTQHHGTNSTQNWGEDFNHLISEVKSPFLQHKALSEPPQQRLLPPSQIHWFYKDPMGNEQGPFSGEMMHSWYLGNYLTPDLNIRRQDEFNYTTLQHFIQLVGDYQQPFLVPLPDLNYQAYFQPAIQQPQPQSLHQQLNGAAASTASQGWSSGRSSPWVSNDPSLNGRTQSPFLNNFNTYQQYLPQQAQHAQPQMSHEDDFLNQLQSQVLSGVLKDEYEPVAAPAAVPAAPAAPVVAPASEPAVEAEAKPAEPETKQTKPKQEEKPKEKPRKLKSSTAATKEVKKSVKPVTKPATTTTSTTTTTTTTTIAPATHTAPPEPVLAPWANKAVTKPELTLQEIQQLEAQELAKQQAEKEQQEKILQSIYLSKVEEQDKKAAAAALPVKTGWGTVNSTTVKKPTKSLIDIQKEEAELEAKKLAKEQELLNNGDSSVSKVGSFASVATTPVNNNPWTTVTKKPVSKPASSAAKIQITTSKANTPDVLRSVSATTPTAAKSAAPLPASSSSNKNARQEFLQWCNSQMKLNSGVNKQDVLSIMLMLPISNESGEIIADTIYSNSSIMDGRRFSKEFMKRRKAVEEECKYDGLSWSEALSMSNSQEDDGWDFQVVSKRKGRKN